MDIRLRRTIPCGLSGLALELCLHRWCHRADFNITSSSPSRYAFERGLRGWRLMFARGVGEMWTQVVVEPRPEQGLVECSLRCRSWAHMQTPAWLIDDRAPLEEWLDQLAACLCSDKCELDTLLSQTEGWEGWAPQAPA